MESDAPLLEWLHDAVREMLRAHGATEAAAAAAAADLGARLQRRFGPGRYYVPAADLALRNGALLQDYLVGQLRVRALADKYGLSPSWVRTILAQAGVSRPDTAPPAAPSAPSLIPSDDPFL
jgi:Mor family transcriptional regulator